MTFILPVSYFGWRTQTFIIQIQIQISAGFWSVSFLFFIFFISLFVSLPLTPCGSKQQLILDPSPCLWSPTQTVITLQDVSVGHTMWPGSVSEVLVASPEPRLSYIYETWNRSCRSFLPAYRPSVPRAILPIMHPAPSPLHSVSICFHSYCIKACSCFHPLFSSSVFHLWFHPVFFCFVLFVLDLFIFYSTLSDVRPTHTDKKCTNIRAGQVY